MTTALPAITEELSRRALCAALALLVGAALLCTPARAQGGGGAAATVSLSLGTETVAESRGGARTVAVTAALDGAAATEEVVVQLEIGDGGTATEGADYTAVTAIPAPRITSGRTDATVSLTLTLTDDTTVEADETIVVTGTAPGHAVVPATLTITDADRATVGVSRGPPYVLHRERGRYFAFSVTLDVPVDAEVRIPWGVYTPSSLGSLTFTPPGGTQTVVRRGGAQPDDVTPSSGTVTLGGRAGMAGSPITLEVVDDDLSEGYESVGVEAGGPVVQPQGIADRVVLATPPRAVVGHIGPSDPVTVSLSGPDTVDEGDVATYTLSVLGPDTPTAPLTVTVTAEGVSVTDLSGPPPPQVTITAHGRSVTFTIAVRADTTIEGDETLTVRISDPVGGGGGGTRLYSAQSSKETTIVDGDHSPVSVSFGERTISVTKGGSGAVATVSLSASPGRTVEIPITKSPAAGVDPGDYGGVPETVTLGPLATTATFTVTAAAGTAASGDRVTLGFGTLPDDLPPGPTSQMTVSLVALAGTIRLSAGTSTDERTLPEGASETMTLTATAVGGTPPGDLSFQVSVSDGLGTADENDYSIGALPMLGVDAGSGTVSVRAIDDGVLEANETIVLTASVPGYAVQPATITIRGLSSERADLIVTPVQVQGTYREGSVISFIPLLDRPVDALITFDYSISNIFFSREDDFSPARGSHTFHGVNDVRRRGGGLYAGPLLHIAVTDDNLSEGRETFRLFVPYVRTSSPSLPSDKILTYSQGSIPGSSLSIDPSDPVALSLSGPDTVAEGSAATYTVSVLPGVVRRAPVTVDISVEGAGSGDLSGVPVSAAIPKSVTIPANRTTATFRLSALDDGADEEDETFTVTIGNPTGGDGGGFEEYVSRKETTILGTAGPARVTAWFGDEFLTVVEGAVASVTVRLGAMPGRALEIPVTWRHEGGAGPFDHGEISGTVEVGANATAGVLTVSAVADAVDETGERVRLGFGDLPAGVVAGDPDRAVVLIADSAPSGIVRLSANQASVPEGFNGSITVTASVDGAAPVSDLRVTLSEESAGGDHTLGSATLPVVTISSGQLRGMAAVRLTVPQDNVVEPGRMVVVTAVAPGRAVEPLSVAIVDNDRAVLDVASYEDLGRAIRLEVTLEGQVDGRVSVPWSAVGDGVDANDVDPASGTLVFEPNAGEVRLFSRVRQAFGHVTVTILDDRLSEEAESARFRLGDPVVSPGGDGVAARIGFRRRQSDARSVTDPPDPLSVGYTGTRAHTVIEGDTVTHTVALRGDSRHTAPVTVDLSASLAERGGEDAAEAADFSSPASVVIPVGATSATLTVATVDDAVVEPTETFQVTITAARGGGGDGFDPAFGEDRLVAITDNDMVTVSFTEGELRFPQRGAVQSVSVTLSAPSEHRLTVDLTTNLDLTDPGFTGLLPSLVFGPGQTLVPFGITLDRDIASAPNDAHIRIVPTLEGYIVGSPDRVDLIARVINADPEFDAPSDTLTVTVAENLTVGAPVGAPVSATDDNNDPLVYSFVRSASSFEINADTGQITLAQTLDHEDQATLAVTVGVSDGRGPMNEPDISVDDELIVEIHVSDVNEPVTFFLGGPTITLAVDEDAERGHVVANYANSLLDDPEGDRVHYFFVSSDGTSTMDFAGPYALAVDDTAFSITVMFPDKLDFETSERVTEDGMTVASHTVTVGFSDRKDEAGEPDETVDDTGVFEIVIRDVDEPPMFQGTGPLTLTIEEYVPVGRRLGGGAVAFDPEQDDFHTYFWDGTTVATTLGPFGIDSTAHTITIREALDYETQPTRFESSLAIFPVPAEGIPQAELAASVMSTAPLTITVRNVNENPRFNSPGDVSSTLVFTVAENAAVAVSLGDMPVATDPEGDPFRYFFWDGSNDSDVSGPLSLSGPMLLVGSPPDHEADSDLTVTVGVSDWLDYNGENWSSPDRFLVSQGFSLPFDRVAVSVTVTDVDEPPEFDGLSAGGTLSRSVDENSAGGIRVGGPVSATDPENATLTYSIEEDADPSTPPTSGLFDIEDDTGQITVAAGATLNHETADAHTVVVEVADGTYRAQVTVEIAVNDVNEPPSFVTDPPAEIVTVAVPEDAAPGTTVTVLSWEDEDEEASAILFFVMESGPFEVPPGQGAVRVRQGMTLDHESQSTYTLVLGLTDGLDDAGMVPADSDTDATLTMVVTVTDVNEPPEFDGVGVSPTLSRSVDENSAEGTRVGGPVSATDPENAALTYSIAEDAGPSMPPTSGLFGIEDGTGQITVAAGATLDHETADAHTVVVEVADGAANARVTVEIAVNDVNEPPSFVTDPPAEIVTVSVPENSPPGTTVTVLSWEDEDEAAVAILFFVVESGPFEVPPGQGAVRVRQGVTLDHESQSVYMLTLGLTDGLDDAGMVPADSDTDDTLTMVVTVTDVNEPPSFVTDPPAETVTVAVPEDAAPGTTVTVLSWEHEDEEGRVFPFFVAESGGESPTFLGPFEVSPETLPDQGIIRVREGATLDHESQPVHTLTLGLTDGLDDAGMASETADDTLTVVVTVTDVNEPPEFGGLPGSGTLSWSVDENSAAGTEVGGPVSVTDPEMDTLFYSLEEDGDSSTPPTAGLFEIDDAGQVAVATGAELDHEDAASHTVVVAVSDRKDAAGAADTMVDARAVAVIAVADVNDAPTFVGLGAQPLSLTVLENASAGTSVGAPVLATDQDGDTLTYSLEEDTNSLTPPTSGLFGIEDDTGQITVAAGATLDHEAAASHTVVVAVSDEKDAADGTDAEVDARATVVIAVDDVNEAPTFGDQPLSRTVPESAGAGATVGSPVVATDPDDGDTLTYSLEEDDNPSTPATAGLFGIDDAGQITVSSGATLSATSPHTVIVAVSDGRDDAGGTDPTVDARATVTVTVLNEPPEFEGLSADGTLSRSVAENSATGTPVGDPVSATDPEGDTLSYSLGGDGDPETPDLFGIDADTGQIAVSLPSGEALDHESVMSHTVVVSVSDGRDMAGGDDSSADISATVVIVVGDVYEGEPDSLTVTVPESGPGDSLSVGWQAPGDASPTQTYAVEYRESGDTEWMHATTVTETSATIGNLMDQTEYDVRVRALNDEGGGGDWAMETAVETGIGVNLRLLPRVAGPGNADVALNGDDALLIFYFTQFNGLLSRPSNIDLSRIIVRGLVRGGSLSDEDADAIIEAASALGAPGGIPDSHPANLYDADPFVNHDALLLFYSIQFGGLLTRPALADLMEIVVDGVLPRGHGLDQARMRVLIQTGRDLAGTL